MKFLCSGDLYEEPITAEECMACSARLKIPPCQIGLPVLRAIFKGQEDRSEELHVTDLLRCPLQIYLDKTDPQPRYVADLAVLFIGIAVHAYIAQANEDHAEIPVEFDDIVGRVDYVDGEDIWDFKTTRWLSTKNGTPNLKGNTEQLNLYRAFMDKTGDIYIQYLDVTGPPTCPSDKLPIRLKNGKYVCTKCGYEEETRKHLGFHLKKVKVFESKDILAQAKDRANKVRTAQINGVSPDPEPGWQCKYCPHAKCEWNPLHV